MEDDLLKLETLEKEYDITLNLYQEALNNYISTLNSVSENPCAQYKPTDTGISKACYDEVWQKQGCTTDVSTVTQENWAISQTLSGLVQDSYLWSTLTDDAHRTGCYGTTTPTNPNTRKSALYPVTIDFAQLKGRSWWGTGSLAEGTANTTEECEAMCASDANCTGATFNPVRKYCWTRKGDGNLTTGTEANIALIPKQKAALAALKSLNKRLLDLNDEITVLIRKIQPKADELKEENDSKQIELTKSYDKLVDQKVEMERQMQEYLTLDQETSSGYLETNSNRLSYRFWALFTLIIVIITLKQMAGGGSLPLNVLFWLIMIILLVIMCFDLTTPSGFLIWFGLIIVILLMRTGNLPSP